MQNLILSLLLSLLISFNVYAESHEQPTDLMAVYELAKQNDPQIRAARAQQNATQELRPQALSATLPNISVSNTLSLQAQDIDSASANYNEDYASNSLTLSLTYPLYRKDLFIALDQTDDQLAQADANYSAAEQALIVRVAQAYFGILSAKDDLGFAIAEKKAIARQLDQAKQRFNVGLIAVTDVHEIKARHDQAEANRISAENEVDNAYEALYEIIQQSPKKLANLMDKMELVPPQPENIDVWNEDAQKNNPAILAAKLSADIARRNISAQKSGFDPSVNLNASINSTRSDSDFATNSDTGTISLVFSMPIYQGGGVDAKVRQANHQFNASQESLDQQRRAIERQVRNAYRGILTSISRVKALLASEKSAKSALKATEAGFDAGTRTLVDVLNSQRDLYRARKDYAQSRYAYVLNTLSLLQAVGTLSIDDLRQVNGWLE